MSPPPPNFDDGWQSETGQTNIFEDAPAPKLETGAIRGW